MIFIYPKELKPGDKLRIMAEGQVWWETVDSITVTEGKDKVMVFTKARMIMCDAGDKVTVQREAE